MFWSKMYTIHHTMTFIFFCGFSLHATRNDMSHFPVHGEVFLMINLGSLELGLTLLVITFASIFAINALLIIFSCNEK